MAFTGDKVVATAWGLDAQRTDGTTGSTTYTPTLTGGVPVGCTFTAPPSGVVAVHYACEINGNVGLTGVEVRAGGVIGSGAVVGETLLGTANDNVSIFSNHDERKAGVHYVPGLTPGATYNARSLFRVTAGTSFFGRKHLLVQPVI